MEDFYIEYGVNEKVWKFAAIWSVINSVFGSAVTTAVIGAFGYYSLREEFGESGLYLICMIYVGILYVGLKPIYHRYMKRRPRVCLDRNSIFVYDGDICTGVKYEDVSCIYVSRKLLLIKTIIIKSKNDNYIEIVGVQNISEIENEISGRISNEQAENA